MSDVQLHPVGMADAVPAGLTLPQKAWNAVKGFLGVLKRGVTRVITAAKSGVTAAVNKVPALPAAVAAGVAYSLSSPKVRLFVLGTVEKAAHYTLVGIDHVTNGITWLLSQSARVARKKPEDIRGAIRKVIGVVMLVPMIPFAAIWLWSQTMQQGERNMPGLARRVTNWTFGLGGTACLVVAILTLFGVATGPALPLIIGAMLVPLIVTYGIGMGHAAAKFMVLVAENEGDVRGAASEYREASVKEEVNLKDVAREAKEAGEQFRKNSKRMVNKQHRSLLQMFTGQNGPGRYEAVKNVKEEGELALLPNVDVLGTSEGWVLTINGVQFHTWLDEEDNMLIAGEFHSEQMLFNVTEFKDKAHNRAGFAARVSAQ